MTGVHNFKKMISIGALTIRLQKKKKGEKNNTNGFAPAGVQCWKSLRWGGGGRCYGWRFWEKLSNLKEVGKETDCAADLGDRWNEARPWRKGKKVGGAGLLMPVEESRTWFGAGELRTSKGKKKKQWK